MTVLEEIIDNLKTKRKVYQNTLDTIKNSSTQRGLAIMRSINYINEQIIYLTDHLDKEKQQVMDAYIYGLRNGGSIKALSVHQKQADQYFTNLKAK